MRILKKIFAFLVVTVLSLTGICLMHGCGNNNSTSNKGDKGENKMVISTERLVNGTPVTLENSPVYEEQAKYVKADKNVLKGVQTGLTDKTFTIDRSEKHGGGQFIQKLFTEALSRSASGEEFMAFQNYIVENGCTVKTLKVLAKTVFSSQAYKSFSLNRIEQAFCIYRAILSRDPSENEVMGITMTNALDKIDEIMDGQEFASLMDGIKTGPYYWNGNNREMWTGDVITQSKFNSMMQNAKNNVLELPQGSLIVLTNPITIPDGLTIRTEGNPDHYVRYARFLRVGVNKAIGEINSNVVLQNLFFDGNWRELDVVSFGVSVVGKDNVIWGCRVNDTPAPIHSHPNSSNLYVAKNLITDYGSQHSGKNNGWGDGLDFYSYNTIAEYNHVVDATDAGIVIFRARENDVDVAQNSIIRYNVISNTGNSAYCGIDNEGVDMKGNESADFTGTIIYCNEMYTSYVAHMHMCLTLSARPWTENYKMVTGVKFYNNYTPAGCFINTAAGIVAEGAHDGVVHGNQFTFYIGDWTSNFMGGRLYAVNGDTCNGGDYQAGYINLSTTSFISSTLDIEYDKKIEVKIGYVYENFVDIPESAFSWNVKK